MASLVALLIGGEADGEFHEVDSIRTQGNRLLPPEQLSVDGHVYNLVADNDPSYFKYVFSEEQK